MAGRMDSLQESLTCPICFEEFREKGENVPRLLPCSHSLCQRCIDKLIRDNRLECPTCRMKHETKREEMSFPQNKYILIMMRRRPKFDGEEMDESRRCLEHDENEILFCPEDGCQKTICTLCLSKAHLGHKAVAIKEETKDVLDQLLRNIESTRNKLNAKIKNVEEVSKDAARKTEVSLDQIKKEKEEMIKQYDEMTRQAEDKKIKLNETSGNELIAMRDNVMFLNSIKQSIEEENTYEDAVKKWDTVRGVTENVDHLPRTKTYEYSEYVPGQKKTCRKTCQERKSCLSSTRIAWSRLVN